MKQHVNVHRLLSLMMLVSCFISLAVLFNFFFMVPSVSVLTEFHCLIKSNICQTVIQTSCESRTVSWKLTTKTDCDVQELRCCQYSVDYIFCTLPLIPELMVEENCLPQQQCKLLNDCWIEGMLLYLAQFCQLHVQYLLL